MAKTVDAKTYAKNVLKSAKYISTETIKGINPDLTSFVSEGVRSAKDMYRGVKSIKHKGGATNIVDKILGEDNRKGLAEVFKNAKDDLRTGKIYNPDRESASESNIAKALGFDFNFDDINFDIDDEDVNDTSSEKSVNGAMITIGDRISNSHQISTSIASNKIISGSKRNTRASMLHNERLFGQINSSISIVNASIMNLHKDLATPLNNHIVNSTNFYTTATTELAKQTSYLENMNKLLAERFAPVSSNGFVKNKSNSFANSSWNTVMGNSGIPNLNAWKDIAKKRAMERTGIDEILNPEIIKLLIASSGSPLTMLTTLALDSIVQNGPTARALNRTSNVLRNGFMNVGFNIHNYNLKKRGNGLLGKLASIFDIVPDIKRKDKMDFSKFNRGRADWTGQDSKALQEVIPTQLAAILAAISGQEAKIFDYRSGKFVTASNAAKQFNLERRKNISNNAGGFKYEVVDDFIKADRDNKMNTNSTPMGYGSKGVAILSKDYDTLMSLIAMRSDFDISKINSSSSFISKCKSYGWDDIVNIKSIQAIAKTIYKNRSVASNSFRNSIYSAKLADRDFISDTDNTGVFKSISNGSGLSGSHKHGMFSTLTDTLDDRGHNVFFYLQDYYRQLRMINNRVFNSQGKHNHSGFNNNSSHNTIDIPIDTDALKKHSINRSRGRINSFTSLKTSDMYNDETDSYIRGVDDEGKRTWVPQSSTRASREAEKAGKESFLSKIINKANDFLDGVFYGDVSNTIKEEYRNQGGLLGMIKNIPNAVKNIFDKIQDSILQYAKNKWNKFKESPFGKAFSSSSKDTLKTIGSSVSDYTADKLHGFMNWIKGTDDTAKTEGSYKGGHVKKSGMVSVSEGEMIIPAKYNPYYTGKMSDNARNFIERKNYNKWKLDGGDDDDFFGYYAKGSKRLRKKKEKINAELSDSIKEKVKKLWIEGYSDEAIAKKVKAPVSKVKSYTSKLSKESTFNAGVESIKSTVESGVDVAKEKAKKIKDSKLGKELSSVIKDTGNFLNTCITNIIGSDNVDNIKTTTEEVLKSAKVNLPKTMADGMIGAITAGALTGSGVGILGGFAIGAGVDIIKNSSTISKKLFGEFDQSANKGKGEWVGGKLPSNITKFIKGTLPKTAKAGALGGILGTLGMAPGGLYGGLVLGAGLQLVSGTETFQKLLLGSEGVDHKRRGGLVGSLKVRVIDPLANYVKEGTKKVSEFVKKYVFEPVKNMFSPLKDWGRGLKTRIGNFFKEGAKKVKRSLMEKIDSMMLRPAISMVGKVGKGIIKGAGWVAKKPGQLLNSAARGLTRHNIRMGYSNLSAKERMEHEGEYTGIGGIISGTAKLLYKYTKPIIGKMFESFSNIFKKTIVNPIHEHIIKPIKEQIIDPISKWTKNITNKIKNWLKDKIWNPIKRKITNPIKEKANTVKDKIWNPIKEKAGNVKDKIIGIKSWLKSNGVGTFQNSIYTRWAANASDEDIIQANHYLNGKQSFNTGIVNARQGLRDTISGSLTNGGLASPKVIKTIKNLMNSDDVVKNNDFSNLESYINNLDPSLMDDEIKKEVIKQIGKKKQEIDKMKSDMGEGFEDRQKEFLAKIGYSESQIKNIAKGTGAYSKRIRRQAALDYARSTENLDKKNMQDIDNAIKTVDASKRLKEQDQENPQGAKTNNILDNINTTVTSIGNKIGVSDKDIANKVEYDPDNPEKSLPKVSTNSFNNTPEHKNGDTRQINDADGNSIEQIYQGGKWDYNISNPNTKNIIDQKNEDREKKNKFYDFFTSGNFFGNIKDLFAGKKDEDGERSGGIFGFLKNLFGKGFKFLGGFKGILSMLGIGSLLYGIGKNKAGTKLDSGMRKGMDSEARQKEVENSGFITKIGLGADAMENSIRGRDMTTYDEDDYVTPFMSDRFAKTIGKNALYSLNPAYANIANKVIKKTIGKIPLAGKGLSAIMRFPNSIVKNTALGIGKIGNKISTKLTKNIASQKIIDKSAKSALKKWNKSIKLNKATPDVVDNIFKKSNNIKNPSKLFSKITDSEIAKSASVSKAGKLAKQATDKITDALKKVIKWIAGKTGIDNADEIIEEACKPAAKEITKKGGTKLIKNVAKISIITRAIVVTHAFLSAMQTSKAKTILGILEKPTFGQRLLAGACNAFNELIPGIGGIVPTEFIFSIIYTILEKLGMGFGNLTELRAQAKATVDQYNVENNTTYNIEEYINNVLGETTLGQKIWGGIKSGAKSVWKGIKGFFGYEDVVSNTVGNIGFGSNVFTIRSSTFNNNNNKLNNLPTVPMYKDYPISNNTGSGTKVKVDSTRIAASGTYNKPFKKVDDMKYTGSASGIHTTQKGNFSRFGNTTIDKNGCGPAAACTVLKAYGKNIGINDAANYAEVGGYVAGSSGIGTRASYFGDILNKNGINANYTDTGYGINHAVSSGSPTVLLGQDKNNTSKSRSPFGPNPHYIVTRGIDKRGNVIVDDPELGGTALYKKNILKNAKLGIATGGNSNSEDLDASNLSYRAQMSSGYTQQEAEKQKDVEETEAESASPIQKLVDIFKGSQGIFNKISSFLGNSADGKIFRYIFNGPRSSTSLKTDPYISTQNALNSGIAGQPFTPQIDGLPDANSPYAQYYINDRLDGGLNISSRGEFENGTHDPIYTALPNCTAYASGRFEHISQQIEGIKPGTDDMYPGLSKASAEDKKLSFQTRVEKYLRYPYLRHYAEKFLDTAKELGLQTSDDNGDPQVGAIMVWRKGNVNVHTKEDGMGHVAVVEKVIDKDNVITSESGWHYKTFYTNKRNRNDGGTNHWGASSAYTFIGFIYNPSVLKAGNLVHFDAKTNKEFVYKFLKQTKKFNNSAIAGIMANWANEGGPSFDPTSLEGWPAIQQSTNHKYPWNKDDAFKTYNTLSEYTTNYLHRWYDDINREHELSELNKGIPLDNIKRKIAYDPNGYYDKSTGLYMPGIGLAQWTGENATKLINWCNSNNKDYRTLDGQLSFFINGPYRESERETLFNNINISKDGKQTTPEEAADIFTRDYEGIGTRQKRRTDARAIFDEISKYEGSGSGIPKVVDPTASGSKIDIDYDFTKSKHKYYNKSGSASSINIPTSIMNINDSSDKKIDAIITFLKQIVTNTSYNAAIPNLVDIMKQSIKIMTGLNSGDISADVSTRINNEILLMQNKLEAIAKSV